MKTLKIILVFMLIGCFTFAQVQKQVEIPKHYYEGVHREYTDSAYNYVVNYVKDLGLPDLKVSQQQFHVRIWSEVDIVDIWSDDNKTYYGKLIDYIKNTKIRDSGNKEYKRTNNLLYYSKDIDTVIARRIIYLFDSLAVFKIPTCDTIPGWGKPSADGSEEIVEDGSPYYFEYSNPKKYSLRYYDTPNAFNDVKQAIIINKFLEEVEQILDTEAAWRSFREKLFKDK